MACSSNHIFRSQVEPIVNDVRERGDAAVKEYTAKFDKTDLEAVCTPVAALPEPDLPKEVTDAFDIAYENIRAFHKAQEGQELSVETMPGVVCRQVSYIQHLLLQSFRKSTSSKHVMECCDIYAT
jgi:histidinol dehydrogenase